MRGQAQASRGAVLVAVIAAIQVLKVATVYARPLDASVRGVDEIGSDSDGMRQ
ncbi:hypothetical protein [Rhodococcoides yunnanense]|uniref:hypothetical protein n=1 Tax=Rhodococcoides yunnanense TaxID=278209 RepID=UPI0012E17B56|nr:hypothetical protein [Rhodococcus yunnanensis]